MARYRDKRGEFVTSLKTITEETGLTIRKIRTSTNRLKSTSEMTIKSTNKYTIITICNYDTYQCNDEDERQTERQTERQSNDNQTTNKRQQTRMRRI